MAVQDAQLRVLIAGAGIAGLATAIALTRISGISNLDIQLYEQATELLEIGASIALSPNGMRTLEKLGVDNALSDEIGFRGPSDIPHIFRHWKSNQVVSVDTHINVPDRRHQTTRFHRGHLHAALLKHVPREAIHLGKRVSHAEATEDRVSLHFIDGTSTHGDVLIGADGIKSKVRQAYFPNYKLRFGGKIFMRATFDANLVEGKVPNLPVDSTHWWGPKDNFFASKLGQYTTVGAYEDGRSLEELEKSISWDQPGDVQFLKEKYKNWNPVVKALSELTPYSRLYPNYVGDPLPTWVLASRVTLIGDAAHAHGGAFAAGGSLALDDSLALALGFKHTFASRESNTPFSASNIRRSLSLYDRTRRQHTEELLSIVHHQLNNQTPLSIAPEVGETALISRLKNRPNTEWMTEHDVEKAFAIVAASQEFAVEASHANSTNGRKKVGGRNDSIGLREKL